MNILFFYESMNLGGQQTQTYQIIKRISAKNHQVHWAYLYGEGMQEYVSAYASVCYIPVHLRRKDYLFRPWKLVPILKALVAYCRTHSIDVIVSGSGLGSLLCGITSRILNIKHYRLIGCSLVQVEKTLYCIYRWIKIDSLIDGYFGWPGVFEELIRKGVSIKKCHELNNAVDTEHFHPIPMLEREQFRNSIGISSDDIVIGWIGRIETNMQVGNTVNLAKELQDRGFTQFKLLLVGGGPWYEGIQDLIEESGLKERAILTNWVPWLEVTNYANAMDIVPLLEEDPHGGSIVREAMACGRVALSVDGKSGSQRRFMLPGASILVSPDNFIRNAADAIENIVKDKDLMEQLGKNARKYAELEMSFDTQVSLLLKVMQVTQ